MNFTLSLNFSDKSAWLVAQVISHIVLSVVDTFGILGSVASYILLINLVGSASLHRLLRALSVSDAMFLTGHLLFNVIPQLGFKKWPKIVRVLGYGYFATTAEYITAWLTVIISLERYVAVCKPLRATTIFSRKNTTVCMVVVWTASAILHLPKASQVLHISLAHVGPNKTDSYEQVLNVYHETMLWTQTIIAITVVTVCNVNILLHLQKSKKIWASMSAYTKQQRKNTLIPLWVVLMFLVSQIPQKVFLACYKLGVVTGTKANTISTLSIACSVFNSSINVVIYFLCSERIRQRFIAFLLCKYRSTTPSSLYTREQSAMNNSEYRATQEFTYVSTTNNL